MYKRILLLTLISSCALRADNFGSSVGGSFLGSFMGSSISNAMTTRRVDSGESSYHSKRSSKKSFDALQNSVANDLEKMARQIDKITEHFEQRMAKLEKKVQKIIRIMKKNEGPTEDHRHTPMQRQPSAPTVDAFDMNEAEVEEESEF